MPLSPARCDSLLGALWTGGLLVTLVASNPGPEAFSSFAGERLAQRLVRLARGRDPRIGVLPKPRKAAKKGSVPRTRSNRP